MKKNPFSPWKNLSQDGPASLVVYLVALPLSLGIAMASGTPLTSGIIAGVIGGLIVGPLSQAPLGVSGAAAGLSVFVLSAMEELGSFPLFLSALVISGIIQIIFGFLRTGFISHYLPSSVIKGSLAGIGLIICLKQFPHAVGYDADPEGDFAFAQVDGYNTFSELLHVLDCLHPGPIFIAIASLFCLISWEPLWKRRLPLLASIPAPLVAVTCGIFLSSLFAHFPAVALEEDQLVSLPVIQSWDAWKDLRVSPDFSQATSGDVLSLALILAVVASIQTLLCVEATDKLDPYKRTTPPNRELVAQGVGNIISGLLGGLPVAQVVVRSSSNVQAGGKTKASSLLHGCWLLLSFILIPNWINAIPLASLAAVLMVVGYRLAQPPLFKEMYKLGAEEFIPFIVTVLGLIFTDLLMGITLGMGVALFSILWANYRTPFVTATTHDPGGEVIKISLSEDVSFLNKAQLLQAFNALPSHSSVEIDASNTKRMHPDAREIIENFLINAQTREISVAFTDMEPDREKAVRQVKKLLEQAVKPQEKRAKTPLINR